MSPCFVHVEPGARLSGLAAAEVPSDAWQESSTCPVCGSTSIFDAIEVTAWDGEVGVVTSFCRACEHGFRRRRPTPAWFDEYYRSSWDAAGRSETGRGPVPNRKALGFAGDLLPRGGAMLDVGAGFGDALVAFAAAGFEARGIERSAHRAEHVRELGFACETTPLELFRAPEPLDFVHIHHVLEHVDDPFAALNAVSSLLRDGGHVYVAVPSWQHEHPPQAAHFVPHLSLFSRRSLDTALRAAGLVPVRWSVDEELQVLACRGESHDAPPPAADDLPGDVERWLRRGFGAEGGRRTLAWWKSRRDGAFYETRELGVAPRTAVQLGAVARRLPTAATTLARGRWPWLADATLRVMRIDAHSPTAMPITLQHETASPPIWIK